MDRDSVNGYVSPANYIVEGKLELLNTSGTVVAIDLNDIKGVYFVREFGDSEDLTRKTFTTRPRTEGLWVRLKFKDNETVEGMMPNDLTQNTSDGFLINPPDLRSNTQRRAAERDCLDDRLGRDRRQPPQPQGTTGHTSGPHVRAIANSAAPTRPAIPLQSPRAFDP